MILSRSLRSASVALLLVLPACHRGPGSAADAGAVAAPAALTDQQDLELIRTSTSPLAIVNGLPVPRDGFIRAYTRALDRYAKTKHVVTPAQREKIKESLVEEAIETEILRQHAVELGVDVKPDELAVRWAKDNERYGAPEAFQQFLEHSGITRAEAEEEFRRNLLKEKVYAAVAARAIVDEGELKASFEDGKEGYRQAEQVRSSQILIKAPLEAGAEAKAKAKKRAQEVARKAKAGADFAALAKTYGEDPSKDSGGDVGWKTRSQMLHPYEEAVWALKDGEIVGPVETALGFHVIKKTGYRAARMQSLEEVRATLLASLQARKRNHVVATTLKAWRDSAVIKRFVTSSPPKGSAPRSPTPGPMAGP